MVNLYVFHALVCPCFTMSVSGLSRASVAREPCKCRPRAVQVLFASRASVVHKPCMQ